ncbi:MAG: type II toxin-antitoxin system prevent-host-death family antitoxin [Bifidobacteriaceae bacterium]|jgi:prevent-host-death family protein|nr:type II toxin-antitoxin system prevent-host-death family antitoxin [Bifidobacteriaceae bacterium]
MKDSVGIRELRQDASQVVARVAKGESLTVTDRGRPVARLVPLMESRLDQLMREGMIVPATRPLSGLPGRLPPISGPSLSETLMADRGDRL